MPNDKPRIYFDVQAGIATLVIPLPADSGVYSAAEAALRQKYLGDEDFVLVALTRHGQQAKLVLQHVSFGNTWRRLNGVWPTLRQAFQLPNDTVWTAVAGLQSVELPY